MQMRCYSGLPVQTDVLRFFETSLLMVQRGATLLSPAIGFAEFTSFHSGGKNYGSGGSLEPRHRNCSRLDHLHDFNCVGVHNLSHSETTKLSDCLSPCLCESDLRRIGGTAHCTAREHASEMTTVNLLKRISV